MPVSNKVHSTTLRDEALDELQYRDCYVLRRRPAAGESFAQPAAPKSEGGLLLPNRKELQANPETQIWIPSNDIFYVDPELQIVDATGAAVGSFNQAAIENHTDPEFYMVMTCQEWVDPGLVHKTKMDWIIHGKYDENTSPLTTPCSGTISIQDIRNEFYGGGGPTNMGELGANILGRPWGQTVYMSEFHCKSAVSNHTSTWANLNIIWNGFAAGVGGDFQPRNVYGLDARSHGTSYNTPNYWYFYQTTGVPAANYYSRIHMSGVRDDYFANASYSDNQGNGQWAWSAGSLYAAGAYTVQLWR